QGVILAPQLSVTRCEVQPEDLWPGPFPVLDEEGLTIGAPLSDSVLGLETGDLAGLEAVEREDQAAARSIADRLLPVCRDDAAVVLRRRERLHLPRLDVQRVRSEVAPLLPHDEQEAPRVRKPVPLVLVLESGACLRLKQAPRFARPGGHHQVLLLP